MAEGVTLVHPTVQHLRANLGADVRVVVVNLPSATANYLTPMLPTGHVLATPIFAPENLSKQAVFLRLLNFCARQRFP